MKRKLILSLRFVLRDYCLSIYSFIVFQAKVKYDNTDNTYISMKIISVK